MDRELLSDLLAAGFSLEAIGERVGRHPSTVGYWVDYHGLVATHRDRHAPKGGIAREVLLAHVEAGHSIADIAAAVRCSKGTVRHWLRRYGLRTQNAPGRPPAPEVVVAKAQRQRVVEMSCPRHGLTTFALDGRGYFRCRRCRAAAVTRRRRKVKAILVAEAGGRCCLCGYSRSARALHFHHLDPGEKRLEINAKGVSLSIDALGAEARKCVLLC